MQHKASDNSITTKASSGIGHNENRTDLYQIVFPSIDVTIWPVFSFDLIMF